MNNSLVVKKLQSEDQKNPPSSRPPVEATAYVKDHQQCYLWVYYVKNGLRLWMEKGRVSIIVYRLKSDKVQV